MLRTDLQHPPDAVDRQPQSWPEVEKANATDDNPLGLKDLAPPPAPKPIRWLGAFAFLLLVMGMLATLVVTTVAREKKTTLLEAEEQRLQASVAARKTVLRTWLDAQYAASKRLIVSDVFRLFILDLARQDLTLPLPRSLQDQRPYFQQLMIDFKEQNTLHRATILRRDGAVLLSSPGSPLPVDDLLRQYETEEAKRSLLLSPIRHLDEETGELVVDAVIDFPRVQEETATSDDTLAFLVLTLPVEQILKKALSSNLTQPQSESITLVQQQERDVDQLKITQSGIELMTGQASAGLIPGERVAFSRRDDDSPVYLVAEPVADTPWTLYHIVDARAALSSAHQFIVVASVISLLIVLAMTAASTALWWRRERNHHQQLVGFYRAHAQRVDQQRQFLKAVTGSIGDWLTVSTPNGELVYANPAFEAAIGQPSSILSGKRWEHLIKKPSSPKSYGDDLIDLIDAGVFDLVEVEGRQHLITEDISGLRTDDGRVDGLVHVIRDHTPVAEERRRRLSSVVQTIDAFIQAVELRDPFLLGHTQRVRTHALTIGKRLGLSHDELACLALAASLSQIGKIFIPDEILAKPDRHTPSEEEMMRQHILHTIDILERIDFDLPVVDILVQMHERLDGSGYPNGAVGAEIGQSARILAVADVFCARTAPRSYRDQLTAGKALYHLASNEKRYDIKVVAALAEFVGKGEEIEVSEPIDGTFIDTAIWQQKGNRIREPVS